MSTRTMIAALLALLAPLAGCGSANTKQLYFADGSRVYYVTCDNSYMIDCYEAAGDLCRARGYTAVSPLPGMMMVRGILIKCNS
jgi:hypothetical protein